MPRRPGVLVALAAALLSQPALADPASQVLTVGVRNNMEATLYTPDGPGPFPSVIVCTPARA